MLSELDRLLDELSDDEAALAWARCMRELKDRKLIRTANTPVGDYAERICCERWQLTRMGFAEKSVDARGPEGVRYQIKGRRLTPSNRSRQLGAIRNIDGHAFDILLAVFFDEDLVVQEIWSIPHAVVAEAVYVAHTNSTNFSLTKKVQADPRVRRIA